MFGNILQGLVKGAGDLYNQYIGNPSGQFVDNQISGAGKAINNWQNQAGAAVDNFLRPVAQPIANLFPPPARYNIPNIPQPQAQGQAPSPSPIATTRPTMAPTMQPTMAPQPTQSPYQYGNVLQGQAAAGLGRRPDIGNYKIAPDVKIDIGNAAKEFGVNPQLLYDVAASESGFNPQDQNNTPEGQAVGVPEGLYQFTPNTWGQTLKNYASMPNSSLKNWLVNGNVPDRTDPVANARAAAYLMKFGQAGKWYASMGNPNQGIGGWGANYTPEELKPYFAQTPGWNGQNYYEYPKKGK